MSRGGETLRLAILSNPPLSFAMADNGAKFFVVPFLCFILSSQGTSPESVHTFRGLVQLCVCAATQC